MHLSELAPAPHLCEQTGVEEPVLAARRLGETDEMERGQDG